MDVWVELTVPRASGQGLAQVVAQLTSLDGRVAAKASRAVMLRSDWWSLRCVWVCTLPPCQGGRCKRGALAVSTLLCCMHAPILVGSCSAWLCPHPRDVLSARLRHRHRRSLALAPLRWVGLASYVRVVRVPLFTRYQEKQGVPFMMAQVSIKVGWVGRVGRLGRQGGRVQQEGVRHGIEAAIGVAGLVAGSQVPKCQ